MESALASRLSFADRALEELREWPALQIRDADCPAGVSLAAGPRQIVHLHWPGEAELCLTWPVIERLSVALAGSDRAWFGVGSDWIHLRLECDSDVRLLVPLVSLAIQANTQPPGEPA